jgi:hypothetical protein
MLSSKLLCVAIFFFLSGVALYFPPKKILVASIFEKKNIFMWKKKGAGQKMADVKEVKDEVKVEAKAEAAKPEIKPENTITYDLRPPSCPHLNKLEAAKPEPTITYDLRTPSCPHLNKPKCSACPLLNGFQSSPIFNLVSYWLYILLVAIFFGAFLSLVVRAVRRY